MRHYRPDLRSRGVAFAELKEDRLHMSLLKIVDDLDPTKKEVADVMNVRFRFAAKTFLQQVAAEQGEGRPVSQLSRRGPQRTRAVARLAEQETSPRWQANYDLVYAQLLAYTARPL